VTGDWRKPHSEDLYDVHSSSNIMIKSRMRWAGHVARMEKRHTEYWWRHLKERDHFEDQCIWTGLIWLRKGTGDRLL
jgi:hypothetical protein